MLQTLNTPPPHPLPSVVPYCPSIAATTPPAIVSIHTVSDVDEIPFFAQMCILSPFTDCFFPGAYGGLGGGSYGSGGGAGSLSGGYGSGAGGYGGYGKPSYAFYNPYGGYGVSGYEGPYGGITPYWQPGIAYPPYNGYGPSSNGEILSNKIAIFGVKCFCEKVI